MRTSRRVPPRPVSPRTFALIPIRSVVPAAPLEFGANRVALGHAHGLARSASANLCRCGPLLPGGRDPKAFSMSAQGVAKFVTASPIAARKVVESYAFPKEDPAPKILPAQPKRSYGTTFGAVGKSAFWKRRLLSTKFSQVLRMVSAKGGGVKHSPWLSTSRTWTRNWSCAT